MSEWCKCGQLLHAAPDRHHPSCLVRITFEQGKKSHEFALRQTRAAEARVAQEQQRTKAAEVAAEAAAKQARANERDRKQQQRQRERQEREDRERREREDEAAEALHGWRSRLAQLTHRIERDPERACLDLERLREDVEAEGLSARDFNPAEREAFSRFKVDVDAAATQVAEDHGPAVASVRRWIALVSQRVELESAAREELDTDGVLPSYEDAVRRSETARQEREKIESWRFPPPESGWAASTTPLSGGLEAASRAAQEAWVMLDHLPPPTPAEPEPKAPEPPTPPAQPIPPVQRWPTDRDARVLTAVCGGLCLLAGLRTIWLLAVERALGRVATAEVVVLFISALGAAAIQLAVRRREALAVLDQEAYLYALGQHRQALILAEEQQREYERELVAYHAAHAAHEEATARHGAVEAKRTACQGIIAQAAQRLRAAHREASQREEDAQALVTSLEPLRKFDADPERGGFLAAMVERRPDLRDDIREHATNGSGS